MPSDQSRLRDVFKHIDRIKAAEYPAIVGSDKGYRIVERPWQDMPEPSKLAILKDSVNWEGVSNRDQAHILLGEIDPGKIPDGQRNRLIEAAACEPPSADRTGTAFADLLRGAGQSDNRSDFQRLLDEAGERGKTQSTEQDRGGTER